jgi:hypothetical protein
MILNWGGFFQDIFNFVAREYIANIFLIELSHIPTTIEKHTNNSFNSMTINEGWRGLE